MRIVVIFLILTSGIWRGRADSVITATPSVIGFERDRTSGFSFSVSLRPVVVTSMGIFDAAPDGLQEAHSIGLWDTSGGLLGSVTIAAGAPGFLEGRFRYVDLANPITLKAGQTYVLGASYSSAAEVITASIPSEGVSAAYSPLVMPGDVRRNSSPGFSFPDVATGPGAIIGPNARITIVPEPAPTILITVGLVLHLGLKLRRSMT